MTQRNNRRMRAHWGRTALAGMAVVALLTGCGGGGGGGGSTTTTQAQTASVTGQLKDQTTSNVLPNRTVAVANTSLTAVSDAQGNFTLSSVPVTSITLNVTDSNGTSDGTAGPYNLSSISGSTKNIGVVTLNIYGSGGGPPAPP